MMKDDAVIKLWPSRGWDAGWGWVNRRREAALCAVTTLEFFPGINPKKPVLVRVNTEPKPGYLEFRLSKFGTLGRVIYVKPVGRRGESNYVCEALRQAAEKFKLLPDATHRHVSVHVLIENA